MNLFSFDISVFLLSIEAFEAFENGIEKVSNVAVFEIDPKMSHLNFRA